MPFHPSIVGNLAQAGANIVIDALALQPGELNAVVKLWDQGSGSVTIKNAGGLPPANLVAIARALGSRVTLEE